MKILLAYVPTEEKDKNGNVVKRDFISIIRTYEEITDDLRKNIVELSATRGFVCSNVLVIDGTDVIYEFKRGITPRVNRRADVVFAPVRAATKHDNAMVKRAWDKALFNLKCANMFM